MTTMPPFPTVPAPEDWYYAARAIYRHVPNPFAECLYERLFPSLKAERCHDDPLGYLVACARDRMRTRHCNSPRYGAFLVEQERHRRIACEADAAARALCAAAQSAEERAEEEAFYADGGTAVEWAIESEAKQQVKSDTSKKRAISRMRAKARTTPTRKRTSATAPTAKESQ